MIINPGLQSRTVILVTSNKKGGGVGKLPCMGYIGMCGPKGYRFSAVLVINRVFELILAILVIYRLWFLHFSLDLGTFHHYRRENQQKPFTNYVYGNSTLV